MGIESVARQMLNSANEGGFESTHLSDTGTGTARQID